MIPWIKGELSGTRAAPPGSTAPTASTARASACGAPGNTAPTASTARASACGGGGGGGECGGDGSGGGDGGGGGRKSDACRRTLRKVVSAPDTRVEGAANRSTHSITHERKVHHGRRNPCLHAAVLVSWSSTSAPSSMRSTDGMVEFDLLTTSLATPTQRVHARGERQVPGNQDYTHSSRRTHRSTHTLSYQPGLSGEDVHPSPHACQCVWPSPSRTSQSCPACAGSPHSPYRRTRAPRSLAGIDRSIDPTGPPGVCGSDGPAQDHVVYPAQA